MDGAASHRSGPGARGLPARSSVVARCFTRPGYSGWNCVVIGRVGREEHGERRGLFSGRRFRSCRPGAPDEGYAPRPRNLSATHSGIGTAVGMNTGTRSVERLGGRARTAEYFAPPGGGGTVGMKRMQPIHMVLYKAPQIKTPPTILT